ncbi:unnamed protein product, partial [Allacma fusca]
MNPEDHLTDTCSLEALSEQDEDNLEDVDTIPVPSTPVGRVGLALGTTPTPLFSMLDIHTPVASTPVVLADPKVAYFVGDGVSNNCNLLNALKELGVEGRSDEITESNA